MSTAGYVAVVVVARALSGASAVAVFIHRRCRGRDGPRALVGLDSSADVLLGSVADEAVHAATRPVLLAPTNPAPDGAR
ncbi:hypothetical protein ACN27F_30265 [Solwaraspora sp. WMMB335]|uniref:hypothetical protein n=1 Tax=Solwaraspora sp. WMMB335 TaxID=3404118 RepID=UPI003B955143